MNTGAKVAFWIFFVILLLCILVLGVVSTLHATGILDKKHEMLAAKLGEKAGPILTAQHGGINEKLYMYGSIAALVSTIVLAIIVGVGDKKEPFKVMMLR